jgi:hypothetical protein
VVGPRARLPAGLDSFHVRWHGFSEQGRSAHGGMGWGPTGCLPPLSQWAGRWFESGLRLPPMCHDTGSHVLTHPFMARRSLCHETDTRRQAPWSAAGTAVITWGPHRLVRLLLPGHRYPRFRRLIPGMPATTSSRTDSPHQLGGGGQGPITALVPRAPFSPGDQGRACRVSPGNASRLGWGAQTTPCRKTTLIRGRDALTFGTLCSKRRWVWPPVTRRSP